MTAQQITDPAKALQFMLAGKAVVTLKSGKTGNHFTFKVKKAKDAIPNGPTHFVAVRTGGAGEKNFAYLGFLTGSGRYVHGRKSKLEQHDPRVRAFEWATRRIITKQLPPDCEIWHEGQCGRCGRALTDPESISRGIGPECASKMGCY